ncbi:MAG: hypothetical protein ACLSBH_18805 [Coprobacillus cateniformis]
MNSHCGWFDSVYGKDVNVYRFMIIPTKNLEYAGDFTHKVRIIRKGKLKKFKGAIKEFLKELSPFELHNITDEKIQELIDNNQLYPQNIEQLYSDDVYQEIK